MVRAVHELAEEKTSVGRGRSNSLVIADPSISEHQCDILVWGTEVIVRAAASTNGTFVGGVRVKGQLPVNAGQTVRFGAVETRLEFSTEEQSSNGDSASDITAVHAFAKYNKSQTPPSPKSGQDIVVPTSGAQEVDRTLALPKPLFVPAQAPATASRPQVEAKACSFQWLWWIAGAAVVAGAMWMIFFHR